MKKNLVSIIIVSFNAERFIEKTVHSCLNQTYRDIELLIYDNGSSDNTANILRSIDDERLRVYYGEENIGPFKGLNYLIDYAKGEYIAIQDHDDIWFPEKIEEQVDFLRKEKNFNACGTGVYTYYEKAQKLIRSKKKSGQVSYVPHTTLLFRNQGYYYDTERFLPDEFLERKTIGKGKINALGEALSVHRIREDGKNLSLTRSGFSVSYFKDVMYTRGYSLTSVLKIIADIAISYLSQEMIIRLRSTFGNRPISVRKFQEKFKVDL